jgi:hypothetical protein
MNDDLTYYHTGLADGVEYERKRQHKHDWRKLFRTVVYATFIGSFLAFAALYLLVEYVVPAVPHV